jgi:hypothetical protein
MSRINRRPDIGKADPTPGYRCRPGRTDLPLYLSGGILPQLTSTLSETPNQDTHFTHCPSCGEKLLKALSGESFFMCDNCGTYGEADGA